MTKHDRAWIEANLHTNEAWLEVLDMARERGWMPAKEAFGTDALGFMNPAETARMEYEEKGFFAFVSTRDHMDFRRRFLNMVTDHSPTEPWSFCCCMGGVVMAFTSPSDAVEARLRWS